MFREVAELYNKMNKNNKLSGELKDVIAGYAGRTAMSKAQKAQLDGSVKQAVANVKQAEIATVQGAQKYFKDVVGRYTEEDRQVMLDKYFLTKIGNFPDCYERIANHFFKQKNEQT